MGSPRNPLNLNVEETRLLIEHPERLQMNKAGSLVAAEERIYIHYRNPAAPPKMVFLPGPSHDNGDVNPTVQELTTLPFPDRVLMVGQSLGKLCFRDPIRSIFYVCDVQTEVVEQRIPDVGAAAPRAYYSNEAAYGFGHTASGSSFKIVRFPLLFTEAETERPPTYLDMYDSRRGEWFEVVFPSLSLYYPLLEPAYMSRKHGYLFWKVNIRRMQHLLAFDLNTNDLHTILVPADFHYNISKLSFGSGCDGAIIACRHRFSSTGQFTVDLYTLDMNVDTLVDMTTVHKWRLTEHSCFQPALSSATSSLFPVAGISKGEDNQHLFFLHNDSNIVGFKMHHDGLLWQLVAEYKLDVSPPAVPMDTNERVSKYKAVPVGPRVIKMIREQRDIPPNA
ncbi:PREDICTED: uncharacterized protein LOC101314587 [Fragaria vesca subsp. vesca]